MKPHVVILGAGATIATIPNGDKNGRKSSVMNGLIEKLGLSEILSGISLQTTSDNLEDIYSELYNRPECENALHQLEKRLYDYFASLELPSTPTIYDFLILSLTDRDVIATFNWDPLLLQAYVRCCFFTENLPHIFCLHGNVAMGFCSEHHEFGLVGAVCPKCRKALSPTKLLYPVAKKDYTSDPYIKDSWDATEWAIENAYMLTIFGYSAPSSDKEAVELLKKAWGRLEDRTFEEVSVIDVVSEDKILDTWKDFIYSHHYRYTNDFFQSYLGMFPRRSCETVFAMFQLNVFADNTKGFYDGMTWEELEETVYNLTVEEENSPKGGNYPLHYTHKRFYDKE